MEFIPIVAFRYSGRYGHFRKPYSNVSSLTYPFPPRAALAGLLGAVLGIPKEKVADTFNEDKMKTAVSIERETKTITHVTNLRQNSSGQVSYSIKIPKKNWKPKLLTNIPDSNKPAQIPMELLRNPSFLIYVSLSERMDELKSRLANKRYVYTPCMGLSEFLAELQYIPNENEYAEILKAGIYEISTVVCKDDCSLIVEKLKSDKHHIHELRAPHLGTSDRRFTYKRYLLNIVPGTFPVKMKVAPYKFDSKVITFL
jgi:CRISPR-associated protein Cas5h